MLNAFTRLWESGNKKKVVRVSLMSMKDHMVQGQAMDGVRVDGTDLVGGHERRGKEEKEGEGRRRRRNKRE
jgi:hypothetical protein